MSDKWNPLTALDWVMSRSDKELMPESLKKYLSDILVHYNNYQKSVKEALR